MNKKGFTTIELILTMFIVITIMATITSVTYVYRNESNKEMLKSDVLTYKNTLTKIIYDDILKKDNKVNRIVEVNTNTYKLITVNNNEYIISVINEDNKIGIKYNNTEYLIKNPKIKFERINFYQEENINIYCLDIYFKEEDTLDFHIHLLVS